MKEDKSNQSSSNVTLIGLGIIDKPENLIELQGTVFSSRCLACLESLGTKSQVFYLSIYSSRYLFCCPLCLEYGREVLVPRIDPKDPPTHETLISELTEYYSKNFHPIITPRLSIEINSKPPINPIQTSKPSDNTNTKTHHEPPKEPPKKPIKPIVPTPAIPALPKDPKPREAPMNQTTNQNLNQSTVNLDHNVNSNLLTQDPPMNPILNLESNKEEREESESERVTRKFESFRKAYLDLIDEDLCYCRSGSELERAFNLFDVEFPIVSKHIAKPKYITELNELRVKIWNKINYPVDSISDKIYRLYHEFIQELLSSYSDRTTTANGLERKIWNEFQMLLQKGWFEFDSELNSILWELYELVRKNYSNYFESES